MMGVLAIVYRALSVVVLASLLNASKEQLDENTREGIRRYDPGPDCRRGHGRSLLDDQKEDARGGPSDRGPEPIL